MEERVRLGIVVAEFNYDITYLMLQRALEHAEFLGASVEKVIKVPGSFDMPLAIKKLLQMDNIDAVVTIGAILKGDTDHDQVVAQHAARKMMDLSLEYNKPVALGVSGPGMTRMEATERIEEYAKRGVEAAVKMVRRLK
ncbi:MAG: 6,7-dimethyl-8-ribityllumazine synthase [Candidatus Freyarchaeota archaeon]|nr:6,7-dimethyl-8-ribityllumazine synthase [Candidatus Jordarchaeia archaeon]MBS7267664.1 6,7-dimethyl-8-ribityllumazine synthase [Candidatus Jordarchaeia archaeon]MBS7278936.1 6,7-dimethyl-8-ribityllumazine synthase [Candidatus Jordarchaeia archaeon]